MFVSFIFIITIFFNYVCPFYAAVTESHPVPGQSCASSSVKNVNETEDGFYLGSVPNSHIAYRFNSKQFKTLNVSVEIKTVQENGIIFYVIGSAKKDFFGLYLKRSELQVSYHCDGYLNSYTIRVIVNNGKWHKLQFISDEEKTKLIIDNDVYSGKTSGCKKNFLHSPYYFGAVDNVHYETAKLHLEDQNKQFVGCMRNIDVGEQEKSVPVLFGLIPCLKNAESGLYFSGNESYAIVDDNFKPGRVIEIRMKIKPKTNNGVLLYYQAKEDNNYMIIQLIRGVLKFTVENGNGAFSTILNVTDTMDFCGNTWHSVMVYKNKNVNMITVDENLATPIFDYGKNGMESYGPLYIGGYPVIITKNASAGIEKNYHQYIGCIKDLSIDDRQEDFFTSKRTGNIIVNMCSLI